MRDDGIYETVHITEEDIIDYCKRKLFPSEVFERKELIEWAEENGYVLNKLD